MFDVNLFRAKNGIEMQGVQVIAALPDVLRMAAGALTKKRDGLPNTTTIFYQVPEIHVYLGMIGLQFQNLAQMTFGTIRLVLAQVINRQVPVRFQQSRLK